MDKENLFFCPKICIRSSILKILILLLKISQNFYQHLIYMTLGKGKCGNCLLRGECINGNRIGRVLAVSINTPEFYNNEQLQPYSHICGLCK